MIIIGLTGGIASGKSTLSAWLNRHHYPLIDADRISREVVEPGSGALKQIADAFGPHILHKDGSLDRQALGRIIFTDKEKRRRLNEMLHPLIRARMRKEISTFRKLGAPVVFLDVPLLFEGGLDHWADKTIVVTVNRENQLHRLMTRNGLSRSQAETRIAAQMSLKEKERKASAVIDNNGSIRQTEEQMAALLKLWGISCCPDNRRI
ncbi:dephospho-CoA kinase [Sporolactobacillus sp. Y61]|uniref:Dephospho-CoA kinase n=1 Tax=Sporolactobacillus sp. Y61 TaxID=3160863 RepID=A0AAU8IFC1_9BACL